MPRLLTTTAASALLLLASGCTWVHLAPGAKAVRVIATGSAPAGCEKLGEVAVSVKDSVAFYERNELRVRDELETLARNEAPGLGADTIQPLTPPVGGEQRFAAFRCGASTPVTGTAAPAPRPGGAQTYPING